MNPQTRHPLADPGYFGVILGGFSPEKLGMMPNKKGAASGCACFPYLLIPVWQIRPGKWDMGSGFIFLME